jgi:hypothetical protein
MGIKENWELKDKVCPNCGQVTERQRGITKQNIKRLFSIRWDLNEILIMFMIIMVLFLAWAYQKDTQTCRDYVQQSIDEYNRRNITYNYSNSNQLNTLNLTITQTIMNDT